MEIKFFFSQQILLFLIPVSLFLTIVIIYSLYSLSKKIKERENGTHDRDNLFNQQFEEIQLREAEFEALAVEINTAKEYIIKQLNSQIL